MISIAAQTSMAGDRACLHPDFVLSCSAIDSGNNAVKVQAASPVTDKQPDDNHPSECLASVQLNAEDGKFVGVFREDSQRFMAWVNSHGATQVILWDAPLSLQTPVYVSYKSTVFSCKLSRD